MAVMLAQCWFVNSRTGQTNQGIRSQNSGFILLGEVLLKEEGHKEDTELVKSFSWA